MRAPVSSPRNSSSPLVIQPRAGTTPCQSRESRPVSSFSEADRLFLSFSRLGRFSRLRRRFFFLARSFRSIWPVSDSHSRRESLPSRCSRTCAELRQEDNIAREETVGRMSMLRVCAGGGNEKLLAARPYLSVRTAAMMGWSNSFLMESRIFADRARRIFSTMDRASS